MKWLQMILPSAVSVLVGGMIPIGLFYLKELLTRHRDVADWFEKRYIEDCIDVLHEFFGKWVLLSALPARNVQELLVNPAFSEVPLQSASRLASITGSVFFQNWFNAMRGQWLRAAARGELNDLVKFHTQAASMAEHLNILRSDLLGHRLKSKSDAYRVRELPCVLRFNDALKKMTDHLVDSPDVTTYTAKSDHPAADS